MTKADWLRSEIEKLEGMKKDKTPKDKESTRCSCGGYPAICGCDDYNQALTSIITRYKEELLELEKGV